MFKLMREEKPKENGLYQVYCQSMGWSLGLWADGDWLLIPNTYSREDGDGYFSYYEVVSWDYLNIPRPIDGKSVA